MKKFLSTVLISSLALTACGTATNEEGEKPALKNFEEKQSIADLEDGWMRYDGDDYMIDHPEDWEVKSDPGLQIFLPADGMGAWTVTTRDGMNEEEVIEDLRGVLNQPTEYKTELRLNNGEVASKYVLTATYDEETVVTTTYIMVEDGGDTFVIDNGAVAISGFSDFYKSFSAK